ncbi:MAG TPA: glycosyltransferase family 4 protein [Planctomycetota bacterium]|nr:glycosyltransferase family 4 protein [Planctomycetota bacterium]
MRIIQVIPGSGDNFYCENCVRDHAIVRALLKAGEDVTVVPLYLPAIVDPLEAAADVPVFFGGINAWLQQNFALFRKTPRWLDRLFDARGLLKMAARRAGSVRARGLGEMTYSVLQGADGRQRKELARLLEWLDTQPRPDLVHLSSPLLLGIGQAVRARYGVPIVCTLQDEDVWIDAMEEPWRTRCWDAMAAGAADVAAFVAVSRWFGGIMRDRLRIPADRLHVVPVGIDPGPEPGEPPQGPPAIGYLARMSASQGLGLLAEAYLRLRKGGRFPGLRLRVSGGSTADDEPFLEDLRGRFAAEGASSDVELGLPFDPPSRRRLMASLSVLSVPAPNGVAFGTYILEALAAGVPVVQPRVGSFPEIVEATGGGVLVEPNDPDSLARALGDLLADGARRAEMGRRGRRAVVEAFSLQAMATNTIEVYRRARAGVQPAGSPS